MGWGISMGCQDEASGWGRRHWDGTTGCGRGWGRGQWRKRRRRGGGTHRGVTEQEGRALQPHCQHLVRVPGHRVGPVGRGGPPSLDPGIVGCWEPGVALTSQCQPGGAGACWRAERCRPTLPVGRDTDRDQQWEQGDSKGICVCVPSQCSHPHGARGRGARTRLRWRPEGRRRPAPWCRMWRTLGMAPRPAGQQDGTQDGTWDGARDGAGDEAGDGRMGH